MKYLFIVIFCAMLCSAASAQDYRQDEGALRTSNGYLLYNILQNNSFTLELDGNVDLSSYPVVKHNDRNFEFEKASAAEFGKTEPEMLKRFMEAEKSLMADKLHSTSESKTEIISLLNRRVNFWHYAHPHTEEPGKATGRILKTYFMDFVNGDLIFRLSYPSATGNESEAKQYLQSILNNFRFYKSQLDFDKLSKSVESGLNYYTE